MPYTRVDDQTVQDEFGNQLWFPDPGKLGLQADAAAPPPNPEDILLAQAPSQAPPPGIPLPPPGAPPNPADPAAQLLQPGAELPGPATAPAPPPEPVPAPTPAPALAPPPTTAAQATAQEDRAFRDAGAARQDAAAAMVDAEADLAQREAQAIGQGVQERDRVKAANDQVFAAYAQKADQDSAAWIKEQEEIASAHPDQSRYFASRSGWQKAAWIIGLLASSLSAGADQSRNVALKMLQEAVRDDLADQRATIERRMAASRTKGQQLERSQDRALQRIKDNEAAEYQRISALERYALAQAKIPGAKDRAAALAQVAADLGAQKMQLVEKRVNRFHEEANQAANRSVQYAQMRQQDRQFGQRLREDQRQHTIDTQAKYDLAQVAAQADAARAGATASKDMRTLSRNTGFRVVGPDGKDAGELTVNKEQYDKVATAASTATNQAAAVQKLRAALSKLEGGEYLLRNDAEFTSAIEEAVGPVAKALNGGSGQISDKDSARGYKAVLGVDPNSFVAQLKGPGREEMLKLLDKRIAEIPEKAANEVQIQSGISLPTGHRVAYTPREDLAARDAVAPDAESRLAELGVPLAPRKHPASKEELRAATKRGREFGEGAGAPPLPPDLRQLVEAAEGGLKQMPGKTGQISEATAARIDAWRALHGDEPGAAEAAAAAKLRLEVAVEDNTGRVGAMQDAVDQAEVLGRYGKSPKETLSEAAKRAGIDLSPRELADLVDEINKRIQPRK